MSKNKPKWPKREFKKTFSVTEFFRLILLGKKKEISIRDLKESQIFHTMQQHRQGIDQVGLLLNEKEQSLFHFGFVKFGRFVRKIWQCPTGLMALMALITVPFSFPAQGVNGFDLYSTTTSPRRITEKRPRP